MKKKIRFLNCLYQRAKTRIDAIIHLVPKIKDDILRNQLKDVLNEYRLIAREAADYLNEMGIQEKEIAGFKRFKRRLKRRMRTMFNSSLPHLSELLLKDCTSGTILAIRNRRRFIGCEQKHLELNDKMLINEERTIVTIKNFL